MSKSMLIDATHAEETRVVVVDGTRLEDFDYESANKKQLKGNVYLAKITRVEPSLQAAFVEYGGNRHGFLSFNEIHPDYYQIPVADREALVADEVQTDEDEAGEDGDTVEEVGGDEVEEEAERRRRPSYRGYKIQEVIKRRQIVLVQIVKEERGNKGAALTTYLSLAGRYCVLMPNTNRGGGISRKISNPKDRKRLKTVLDGLKIPEGIAVIVRTAGAERSKAEIKRDYDYLMKQWDQIREQTLASTAPALINEEANLIKRSIRDLYSNQIDQILVEGDGGYRLAKDFMKTLIPSHAVRVKSYKDGGIPIFHRYQVENQIDAIHNQTVQLKSGGYIVLDSTEALVAIDVNSGRSTRERNIEETALKTNMEAAQEVARQLRLRDLAGLIVIDFIDMENSRNIHNVERRLKESLRADRARIQVGRISHFGLLEMSRQRLRPSLAEVSSNTCPTCGGAGHVRSVEATSLHVLRAVEEEGIRKRSAKITIHVPTAVALYILNQKRANLAEIEARYDLVVSVETDDSLIPPEYRLDRARGADQQEGAAPESEAGADEGEAPEGSRRKRRSRRRRSKRRDDEAPETVETAPEQSGETEAEAEADNESAGAPDGEAGEGEGDGEPKKRRRRGRRGGRRRSRKPENAEETIAAASEDGEAVSTESVETETQEPQTEAADTAESTDSGESTESETETAPAAETEQEEVKKPRRRRRSTKAKSSEDGKTEETAKEEKPKRRRSPRKKAEPVETETVAVDAESEAPAAIAEPESVVPEEPANSDEPAPEPEPVEAEPEPVAAESEPVAAEPEPMSAEPEPLPLAASAPEQAQEPDKPKRGGWWQKITG